MFVQTEPLEELLSSRGELIVGLKFVPPSSDSSQKKNQHKGCLQVLVKEAKNLSAVKTNGTSDPFCKRLVYGSKPHTVNSRLSGMVIVQTIMEI